MPDLYVIGGPNGAGKTTTALTLLPQLGVVEFVNADAIASGLSPLNSEGQARAAGRLMLKRLDELSKSGQNFALETTLASRSFLPFLLECQRHGYTATVIYVWLASADLAIQRVAKRVRSGGHNIPEETIRRRYERGRANFFELYLQTADNWVVLNNTSEETQLIAQGGKELAADIFFPEVWDLIRQGISDDQANAE